MPMRKGQSAPRTVTRGLRAKAWWVLRKNRTMTLAELLLTVCTGREKSAANNLRNWLNSLVRAGVLARELADDGKPTSNGSYHYCLVADLGPKAPVIRQSQGCVFDPNANQALPMRTLTHHRRRYG